jgi:extracellular factor (EF) 3-hydroxypalmitic acid methyl ester biosynthesis protein
MGADYSAMTAELIDLLQMIKASSSERVWQEAVLPAARAHGIMRLVHECPFTRHSFSRPRGYPGDAGLLDFVYRHPDAESATSKATPGGLTVMDFTVNVSACEAVRQRKEILARKIDEVANLRADAEVLAIACGHLREAESSIALKQGKVGRLVATDQDPISLETVRGYQDTISAKIDVRNLSVRHFISGKHGLGKFDFIYAAGLYDYLDARVAARLTSSLFNLLKSGGRLLIPNFRTGVKEEAYMELYMDWYLIYRSRAEIEAFANEISPLDIGRTHYFEDPSATIGYLEIERV